MTQIKQNDTVFTSIFTIGFIRLALAVILLVLISNLRLLPAMLVLFLLITTECSRIWSRYTLKTLSVRVTISPLRLFAGEELKMEISWHNRWIPALLNWKQTFPPTFIASDKLPDTALTGSLLLRWYGFHKDTVSIPSLQRGVYLWPSLEVNSRDGLSLFEAHICLPAENPQLLVYPRLISLPEFHLTPSTLIGSQSDKRPILPDPIRISGLRDYTPDMPSRLINWKASAQKGHLLARILEPSADLALCIAVDVEAFHPQNIEAFETALSIAATLICWAEELRIPFGLIANAEGHGITGPIDIPVSTEVNQAAMILECLARLKPTPYCALTEIFSEDQPHFPWGTTLLVLGDGLEKPKPAGVRHLISYPVLGCKYPETGNR